MGSGCSSNASRSKVTEPPLRDSDRSGSSSHLTPLKAVTCLAGKSNAQITDDKLDEAFKVLAATSVEDASHWFATWLAAASSKSQAGLISVMQCLIKQALWDAVANAEQAITSGTDGVGDIPRLAHVVSLCKQHLTINALHLNGLCTAMTVLTNFGHANPGKVEGPTSYLVPSLDRLVLLLRNSHLAHIESSAENLQQLCELEAHLGIPALRRHLMLLSCASKAVILSLTLIPDSCPPISVVVKRDESLLNAREQVPNHHACVLLPYFESTTGTKLVKGTRVEGGEGHGPRKEFFIAATSDAIKKWSAVAIPTASETPSLTVQVTFEGNQIKLAKSPMDNPRSEISANDKAGYMVSNSLAMACVGDSISLRFSNGIELQHIITAIKADMGVSTNQEFEGDVLNGSATVSSCVLRKPVLPLFEFHRGTGQYWFSAYANELDGPAYGSELSQRFLTFGKLLLLALVNRCKMSFILPVMFFHLLLHRNASVTLENLKGFDAELHTSLKKCLKLSASQFNSLREVEGLSAGMTKEEYVAEKVRSSFIPQAMQQVRAGFWSLSQEDSFQDVAGHELQQLLCPMATLDGTLRIRDVFNVAMEDDMADCKMFVDAFWSVVDGLSPEDQRQFLLFVTGSESLPEPGTERLVVEMPFSAFSLEEHVAMLEMLPQAHTCTNTLELPNYYEALKESGRISEDQATEVVVAEICKILRAKLLIAIHESVGYELDATADVPAFTSSQQPTTRIPPSSRTNLHTSVGTPKASGYPPPVTVGGPPATMPQNAFESKAWTASLVEPPAVESSKPPGSSDVDTFLAELEMGLETQGTKH